jgi:hypothetical protein
MHAIHHVHARFFEAFNASPFMINFEDNVMQLFYQFLLR